MRLIVSISALICFSLSGFGQSSISSAKTDVIIKASYILNFAKNANWPEAKKQSEKFRIGVFGDQVLYEKLVDEYSTRPIHSNQVIEVVWITEVSKISDLHMIYVARNKEDELIEISKLAQEKHILLVSDSEKNAAQEAAISFTVVDNIIAYNVNLIQVSSCEIKLGNRVTDWANKVIE